MPRTHRPYPPEFRAEAVRLAHGSDNSLPALAADLGISSEALRHWLRQADADDGRGQPGDLSTDEREELRRLRRENHVLKQERETRAGDAEKSRGLLREGDLMSHYRFIQEEQAAFPIATLCRALTVGRSGYYAWARRGVSARATADAALAAQIAAVHARSRRTYGAPRVHAELRATGVRCARKRVARLMRAAGLVGCHRRRRIRTTVADPAPAPAPNLVARDFTAPAADRLWIGDITFVPTGECWLYLAVLLDAHSRRVIGWAMADHLRADLAADALAMALGRRRPAAGLVHHTDRGGQYTAKAYRAVLAARGIACSMSRSGDCLDNAMAESFFSTPKAELVEAHHWPTRAAARPAIFEWLEVWYNRQRRHSALAYRSPVNFEEQLLLSCPQAA